MVFVGGGVGRKDQGRGRPREVYEQETFWDHEKILTEGI
jgi:hypothetical protein